MFNQKIKIMTQTERDMQLVESQPLTVKNAHRVAMIRKKESTEPPVPFHFRKKHLGMTSFVHFSGKPEDEKELRPADFKDWEVTEFKYPGYLEDLLEQNEVEIVWSRTLKPKTDRKGNPVEYLEEYRINDLGTQQPLWYAHFHFRQQPAQGFTRLEAGHLKLASERDIGEGAWRGSMSEAHANRLFGNLRPAS